MLDSAQKIIVIVPQISWEEEELLVKASGWIVELLLDNQFELDTLVQSNVPRV